MTRQPDADLCNHYDAEKDEVCTQAAVAEVTVKTNQLTAVVPLCHKHLVMHNSVGAKNRVARKIKK